MHQGTLIINFKNYAEILGQGSLELASRAEAVSKRTSVQVIVAPPAPMLYAVAKGVGIPVYSQRVDQAQEGKSTGAVIVESIKKSGCAGSILNHSESRVAAKSIRAIIGRMKALQLSTCLCAEAPDEIGRLAGLGAEYIAIEPPELIGTGIAVSRAKPKLITNSITAARRANYNGRILCGAGIVSADDVVAAMKAGAEGVLVSSSVVRAADWEKKIQELAEPLSRG